MKKSFFIITTALLSFVQMNALNDSIVSHRYDHHANIPADALIQIFEWQVKTNQARYSGTSSSASHAHNMIKLISQGDVILEKTVESFYLLESDLQSESKRVFLWEVTSTNGRAQGYSTSKTAAQKMINLVANGDIITFRIIRSGLLN